MRESYTMRPKRSAAEVARQSPADDRGCKHRKGDLMNRFLGYVLAITAAFAVYKMAVQPMVDGLLTKEKS